MWKERQMGVLAENRAAPEVVVGGMPAATVWVTVHSLDPTL